MAMAQFVRLMRKPFVASNSQVFFDHCLTLALRSPNHPASVHVLWPILQICKDLSQHHAVSYWKQMTLSSRIPRR
jgi:hypothetical protein